MFKKKILKIIAIEVIVLLVFTLAIVSAKPITVDYNTYGQTKTSTLLTEAEIITETLERSGQVVETSKHASQNQKVQVELTTITGISTALTTTEPITKATTVVTTKATTTDIAISNVIEYTDSYNVPSGNNFYGYMDYKCITNTSSAQYKFQQNCYTDSQGLRRSGDDYVVALGSYYSTNIGDRFYITLDTGITYTVVLGDCKSDCHTNYTNQYTPVGNMINIIEFIVDTPCLDYTVAQSGNIGTYNNLAGNIVSITMIK